MTLAHLHRFYRRLTARWWYLRLPRNGHAVLARQGVRRVRALAGPGGTGRPGLLLAAGGPAPRPAHVLSPWGGAWRLAWPALAPGAAPHRALAALAAHLRGLGGWLYLKLRFKGKSFKWHRRRHALVLRFGHSHLVACQPRVSYVGWKRRGKMRLLFFGSSRYLLRRFVLGVVRWRPMNLYHGRGLRLAQQYVWRKAGKVSAYR